MAARRKFSDDVMKELLQDFHSDMSGYAVGKKYGCDFMRTVRRIWLEHFGAEAFHERTKRMYRLTKLGVRNPMYGKSGSRHHRYKPVHISNFGYRHIDAPPWYTGPVDKGKVAEHILVACMAAGITELPEAHIVHHKDENKRNNAPDNLEIMSRARHAAIHRWARHKRKVQRLSRKGVDSK